MFYQLDQPTEKEFQHLARRRETDSLSVRATVTRLRPEATGISF